MSYLKEKKKLDKLRNDLLKFSVSKDETRLHLNAIWHDDDLGALVSTNGYHATILRSRYCPQLSDKLICPKTFTLIEREPVKIKTVIPTKFKTELSYTIEKHHFVSSRRSNKPPKAHFYSDGSISIEDEQKEKERLFTVNASFLKYLVGRTYLVGMNNDLSPVCFSLDHTEKVGLANDIFLVMPLKV